MLSVAWLITSMYTLSRYDLIAWVPLALLSPNRLDGLLTLRGAALSVAYVTGRTAGFSPFMVDVVAFVVRDVICSAIQVFVVVAIVRWWIQRGAERPTRAFVAAGWRGLVRGRRP